MRLDYLMPIIGGLNNYTLSTFNYNFLVTDSVLRLVKGKLFQPSKNLLNKDAAINGKFVNYSTGIIGDNERFSLIKDIPVIPNSYYYFTPMNQFVFRDANGDYISGGSNATTPPTTNPVLAPMNAYTMDVSVSNGSLNVVQLTNTSTLQPYEPYKDPARALTNYDIAEITKPFENDLDAMEVNQAKMRSSFIPTANLADKNAAITGKYVAYNTGEILENPDFSLISDIPVKPNTNYYFTPINQFAWFDSSGGYISGGSNGTTPPVENPITAPSNAATLSISVGNSNLDKVMVSESTEELSYEPYGLKIDPELTNPKNVRLYEISQIFNEWESGNKFPIAFVDDSQTDGVGTTGNIANVLGTDNKSPNAYPYLLEQRMKSLSGKTALRVYNAGFSGKTAKWMNDNFDAEFGNGTPYADTKIAFVGFGTNDRLVHKTPKSYYDSFKYELETLINKFLEKGIQPVMMTEQPTISPSVSESFSTEHPLRNGGYINSISNAIKKDLADKYNLELVDVTGLLRKVINGVNTGIDEIFSGTTDKLHFGDEGHKLVRDVFSYVIYPYTLKVEGNEIIDYTSQLIHKGAAENKIKSSGRYGYTKGYTDYAVSASELLLKQSVYIDDYTDYALRCYKYGADSTVLLKVDGVELNTPNSTIENKVDVITLEPGYHEIEVWSGSANAGLRGLSIVRKEFEM